MQTAVAYIRVSSQRQVEEGGSLDSQMKQVEKYAASTGHRLTRIFREEGESAKTDQRPRLQEMLVFCRDRKNGVGVVIIPKIDRLARNVSDYTNLKLQLSRLGIRLESLGERIEDTPVGRFTETILASVAQFDNEIRAERSKGGMIEAVSHGRWVWKAPIGYRSVRHHGKGTIEPDPRFAPFIREAFKLLAIGHHSPQAVRSYLGLAGISRSNSSFYRMLQNEVYIGRIHAFDKVFAASAPFVPLVDELTFYRAQAVLYPSQLPQHYQLESKDFPLRGSMRCGCGLLYTASWSRGKKDVKYPYYRCSHCRGRSYARKIVHDFFQIELGAYRGHEAAWERLKASLIELEAETRVHEERQRQVGTKRVSELKLLQDGVALKNAAGVIPDDLAKRQIDRLNKEIAFAYANIPLASQETSVESLVEFAKAFFFDLEQAWQDFSLKTKKDLLRFMFPEGILFHPERGFRTPENSLSEQVKRVVSGAELHLVDPGFEFWKTLHQWLDEVTRISET